MKAKSKKDRAWLLATARAMAAELKLHCAGTCLRVRIPDGTVATNTDGWRAVIGDLGKNQPRLEVWYDRFAGYPERKLYAGLRSDKRTRIAVITGRVAKTLWPVRVVTMKDVENEKFLSMSERLGRTEFSIPILEKYRGGLTFYGTYDPTRETAERVSPYFCTRAVSFFLDVAHALPKASSEDDQRDVYPRCENRKRVVSHLQRERSRLLASECKIRDKFTCQVCGLLFTDSYGQLGAEFAEAHHRIPLNKLRENVKTCIDDLTTVCANCHRMLHRMDGRQDDIKKLRAILRKHRP